MTKLEIIDKLRNIPDDAIIYCPVVASHDMNYGGEPLGDIEYDPITNSIYLMED